MTILGIYIGSSNALEQFNTYLNTVVPFPEPYKEKLIKQIVERSNELSSNTFLTGAIGIMALLWTMSGLFGTMRDVINRIFEVSESINYLLHKLRDFLVVLITFLLFIISLSFTSVYNLIQTYSLNILGNTFTFTFFEKILQFVIVFFISFILYYILYSYIPHFKYPKKVVLFMSVIAGFFTELLNYFFTLYVLKFSNFGKIYGTYAALAIFIFWIYYLSVIFVITAEWGYVYIHKNNLKIILRKKIKNNGI